ncbi:alpha/beta hydrolase [Hyphococcus formosus]|uniref:serine aminopeptidase domain-containing protein n=1 Tax=Hyphococcus formosus TaxID=3143534 RepID=UPI00398ACD4B
MAVTPFHFGDNDRTMFGVYHHPEQRAPRAPAVLLCNPFGEEAIRSFRIMRILAERLARAGSPVLRFDYFGSGDSLGPCDAVSISGMRADILTAHEELIDLSGKQRIAWAGLGLGASVAYLAAQKLRPALTDLVMWDPVIEGRQYFDGLLSAHIKTKAHFLEQPIDKVRAREFPDVTALDEVLGFIVPPKFKAELCALDLGAAPEPSSRKVAIIGTGTAEQERFATALQDKVRDVNLGKEEDASAWNSDEAMNAFVVPVRALDKVIESIGGGK